MTRHMRPFHGEIFVDDPNLPANYSLYAGVGEHNGQMVISLHNAKPTETAACHERCLRLKRWLRRRGWEGRKSDSRYSSFAQKLRRTGARLSSQRLRFRFVYPGRRSRTRLPWAITCRPSQGFWFAASNFAQKLRWTGRRQLRIARRWLVTTNHSLGSRTGCAILESLRLPMSNGKGRGSRRTRRRWQRHWHAAPPYLRGCSAVIALNISTGGGNYERDDSRRRVGRAAGDNCPGRRRQVCGCLEAIGKTRSGGVIER